jgi:hypothetical protein
MADSLVPLERIVQSLSGLSYIQLEYLRRQIFGLLIDARIAAQFLFTQSQTKTDEADEIAEIEATGETPAMSVIIRSVLRLSQGELETLGFAVRRQMGKMPSPFPPRDPSQQTYSISFPLSEVFPDEDSESFIPPPETDIPGPVQRIREVSGQAFKALRQGNQQEAERLLDEAIALAEAQHMPTIELRVQRETIFQSDRNNRITIYEEAAAYFRSVNDLLNSALYLTNLATLVAANGEKQRALDLLGEAEEIVTRMTPETLAAMNKQASLLSNLLQNEILLRMRVAQIQRMRHEILSS